MNPTPQSRPRARAIQDLTQLSRSELLDLKMQLDGEIAEIKLQIDQARLMLSQTGQYADREWYLRANNALRRKGQKSQAIQNELSRRRTEKRPQSLETHFLTVARQRLTREVFDDILAEAKELAGAAVEKEPA